MKKGKRFSLADLEVLTGNGARATVQLGKPMAAPIVVTPSNQEKRGKYRNEKVEHGGMKFDSKRELARWLELEQQQRAGKIRNLQRQVMFELAPAVYLGGPRKKPALRYQADFVYAMPTGERIVEDAKGVKTKEYIIKKHLMMSVHSILVREV